MTTKEGYNVTNFLERMNMRKICERCKSVLTGGRPQPRDLLNSDDMYLILQKLRQYGLVSSEEYGDSNTVSTELVNKVGERGLPTFLQALKDTNFGYIMNMLVQRMSGKNKAG